MNPKPGHGRRLTASVLLFFTAGCGLGSSPPASTSRTSTPVGVGRPASLAPVQHPVSSSAEARAVEGSQRAMPSTASGLIRTPKAAGGYTSASPTSPMPRQVETPQPFPKALRPTPRTMIVVDIDETLCVTDYTSVILGIGTDDSIPLHNSPQVLTRLAKEYDVVYLTARPKACESRTRRWLLSRGFPDGRIFTSATITDFVAQTGFKQAMLAKLGRQHRQMLIGIGDKPTDAKAYRRSGMLAVVVNPWKGKRYGDGDVIFRDWAGVEEFFKSNRDLLTDPVRLSEGLQRGRLPFELPG